LKSKLATNIRKMIMIIIGAAITAYGLEAVLIPNSVIDGGVTGVSIMGAEILELPLGLFLFILNIPFVYLGYKQIGKTFAIMSIIGIAALSLGTVLMHHISPILSANDPLLVVASGGILLGVGIVYGKMGNKINNLMIHRLKSCI
jgi:uncharacterized membrane-anchored protein YitT (DUF2179 family)